jgi:hypothetical protein
MAQQQIDNGESAALVRKKLNDNFTELYTGRVPTNHASSTQSYGVGTTANYGHVKVTSGNGLNISNGTISMASASTTSAGAVQLVNNSDTIDDTKAASAGALYDVAHTLTKTYWGQGNPTASAGKIGDIYVMIG